MTWRENIIPPQCPPYGVVHDDVAKMLYDPVQLSLDGVLGGGREEEVQADCLCIVYPGVCVCELLGGVGS